MFLRLAIFDSVFLVSSFNVSFVPTLGLFIIKI